MFFLYENSFFHTGCRSVLPADVVFVVDESGSVGTGNFDRTRHSIIDTIRHLQVRNDFIRIGVMTFDDSSRTVFNLNAYPGNENTMERKVSSMPYSAGSTDIANALRRACNTMFTSTNGDRPNAQNYLVLLTDGQSDANAAQTAATACKASGTRIISVGIGDSIDESMLRNVAYNTNYYIRTNYSDIATFLPTLVTTAVNCGGLGKEFVCLLVCLMVFNATFSNISVQLASISLCTRWCTYNRDINFVLVSIVIYVWSVGWFCGA